jgi:hypothetical protein
VPQIEGDFVMKVNLDQFDNEYFNSIGANKEILCSENGFYYTILCDNEKAGVISFVPVPVTDSENSGYVQIVIDPKFKEEKEEIVKAAEDLIAQRHSLNQFITCFN